MLQKQKEEITSKIVETANISTRGVKKLWARYRYTDLDKIVYPAPMERLKNSLSRSGEHSAVRAAGTEDHLGAMHLHGIAKNSAGINIPYNKIH